MLLDLSSTTQTRYCNFPVGINSEAGNSKDDYDLIWSFEIEQTSKTN